MTTDLDNAFEGECEECKETKMVRRIEIFDIVHSGSRGFANLCFGCFKPRIEVKGSRGLCWSDLRITPEVLENYPFLKEEAEQ